MKDPYIIIFDGECSFCNGLVNFIIKHDPGALFAFTPLHSSLARSLISEYKLEEFEDDTVVLIKERKAYIKSEAVLELAKELEGLWFLPWIFGRIPKSFRDYLYTLIAKNRYKIFAKRESCRIPSEDISSRFLTDDT